MDLVEENAAVLEHFPGHPRLEHPVVGQRGVRPSDEPIVAIPGALAVAQKAEIVGLAVVGGAGEGALLPLVVLGRSGALLLVLVVILLVLLAILVTLVAIAVVLICTFSLISIVPCLIEAIAPSILP